MPYGIIRFSLGKDQVQIILELLREEKARLEDIVKPKSVYDRIVTDSKAKAAHNAKSFTLAAEEKRLRVVNNLITRLTINKPTT